MVLSNAVLSRQVQSALGVVNHLVRATMDFKGKTAIHTPEVSPSINTEPDCIAHGVELLNDDETPMNFVVETLELYLRLDRPTAVRTMLAIHTGGRAVVAVASKADAVRLSRAISNRARHHKFPFVCRAFPRPARGTSRRS